MPLDAESARKLSKELAEAHTVLRRLQRSVDESREKRDAALRRGGSPAEAERATHAFVAVKARFNHQQESVESLKEKARGSWQ